MMPREAWANSRRPGKEQRFGLIGERWAMEQLESRGYRVRWLKDFQAPFDLVVNDILPIEVKIAHMKMRRVKRRQYRPAWAFRLQGGLPPEVEHIVIAICVEEDGSHTPFIIPGVWLAGKVRLVITSPPDTYSGYVSPGLRRWELVDEALARAARYNLSYSVALLAQQAPFAFPEMM